MGKIVLIIGMLIFLRGNATNYYTDNHFYQIYNGTSFYVQTGIQKYFKNNFFVGLNTGIDYLIKRKDLKNQFGKQYSSYETSLNFGYGNKSKSYFSYSLGFGYNINHGKYARIDEFGAWLGTINRKNSFFGVLNVNYNIQIRKKIIFFSGISLKTRKESYHYEDAFGDPAEPYWGIYLVPSINMGCYFVL